MIINNRYVSRKKYTYHLPLCCTLIRQAGYFITWRHNGRDGVSNHRPRDCLLNRLFEHRLKKKNQSSASLALRGIHRLPVNSTPKWPVTWKMFSFDDVIMCIQDHPWVHSARSWVALLVRPCVRPAIGRSSRPYLFKAHPLYWNEWWSLH